MSATGFNYSIVVDEDLTDNRVLYADGTCPSGVMLRVCGLIRWAASGKRRGLFPQRPLKEEPKKPGFYYVDPKNKLGKW